MPDRAAARHVCSKVKKTASSVGPINRPRKPNETKPPENAQYRKRQTHLHAKADEPGLDKIVDGADEQTTPDNDKPGTGLVFMPKQPPSRSAPNHDQERCSNLGDCKQQADKAQHR